MVRSECAGLLQGLESRAHRPEYGQLLADCQHMYCEIRLMLVGASTHVRIQSYAKEPLPLLMRRGWAFLIQVIYPAILKHMKHTSNALFLLTGLCLPATGLTKNIF